MKDVEQYFEAQFAAIYENGSTNLDVTNVANVKLFYMLETENDDEPFTPGIKNISVKVHSIPMIELSDEKFNKMEFSRFGASEGKGSAVPIFKAVA